MLPYRILVQLGAGEDGGHNHIAEEVVDEDGDGLLDLAQPYLQPVLQLPMKNVDGVILVNL